MISGERVRAIRTLRGFPEGGLAMRQSYGINHFNVHAKNIALLYQLVTTFLPQLRNGFVRKSCLLLHFLLGWTVIP